MYGDAVEFSLGYASGDPNYSRELPSPYDTDSLRTAALQLASRADVVLFFGGLNKNFTQDCEGDDRRFYHLPFGQDGLIRDLLKVNPNTAVVIISGNAVEMSWINDVPAIIQSWYLGSYAGTATANVVSGKVNPSGKLPFSYPVKLDDNSAHYFGEESYPGVDGQVYYKDDILVGYRWFDTKKIKPLFPFGFGLSYTEFRYSNLVSDRKEYAPGDTINVSVEIENTGKTDGAETVQFYVSQKNPSVLRPAKELKGFSKISVKAGEKKKVNVAIPVASLAFYDEKAKCWRVENDTFLIHAAASSADVRKTISIKITDRK